MRRAARPSNLISSVARSLSTGATSTAAAAMAERRTIPVIGDSCVFVGRGLLKEIPAELTPANGIKASKFVIVGDSNTFPLFGPKLVEAFMALGTFAPPEDSPEASDKKLLLTYTVPAGEGTKCRAVKDEIEDFMLSHRCNRDTCMIALGGGVVGDLVGFVAATYMRGVPFIQVPTSTMAMVDSSVGGKTAINVPAGKNLIGAFWQPKFVYADMELLETLGKREFVEGIAEAIKMGCIRLSSLFDTIEAEPEKIMNLDPELISEVVYEAIRMKAEVVALDEREAGVRGTLNWGHTIGHAIEAIKSPAMMHGECVSIGCVAEAEVAARMGNADLTPEKIERITKCFASYGLPIHVPKDMDVAMLNKKMSLDKKNQGNSIRCTIVTDIGVSINDPQPVEKDLMTAVMTESMATGETLPEWVPHEGHSVHGEAGGQMAL